MDGRKSAMSSVGEVRFDDGIKAAYHISEARAASLQEEENTPHFHSGTELLISLSGRCELSFCGRGQVLSAGDICIVPKDIAHHLEFPFGESRVLSLLINFGGAASGSGKVGVGERVRIRLSSASDVLNMCGESEAVGYASRIFGLLGECGETSAYLIRSLVGMILVLLSEKFTGDLDSRGRMRQSTAERTSGSIAVENYILNNFQRDLTLSEVSLAIGYSPAYTARKIEKVFGMSFSRIILKLRMSYAEDEIRSGALSLREIAERVGYRSYNGFLIAFKRYFGKTPEEYTREIRIKKS